MEEKFKVLIWGPGKGHNISIILESFNETKNVETTLITQKYSFGNDFFNISILDYFHSNPIFRRIKFIKLLLMHPRSDVLYIQGNSALYELFLIILFGKYKKIIFNVWSNGIINELERKNFRGSVYRFIFKKIDFIQFNWIVTYNIFIQSFQKFEKKTRLIPWGLKDSFFTSKPLNSDFLKNFFKEIENNKYVLLNMRSISDYNAIETLLDSILLIKNTNKSIYDSLLLIFWTGNNIDVKKKEYIEMFIKEHEMQKQVRYVEHPFVSDDDIKHLIERSDVIINLVKNDQMSTSVIEAMLLGKHQILSNIEPYRILNQKHNLNLNLISINPEIVSKEIIRLYDGKSLDLDSINNRKEIVKDNYSMKKNFQEILTLFGINNVN